MKEEILKCEEKQQELNDQILDHQHEQEKYVTVMKENQQKIKYYNFEVLEIVNNKALADPFSGPCAYMFTITGEETSVIRIRKDTVEG